MFSHILSQKKTGHYVIIIGTYHQLTCGEDSSCLVIREWHYGPRRLRVDDDDHHFIGCREMG